jgi:hypothetical protein
MCGFHGFQSLRLNRIPRRQVGILVLMAVAVCAAGSSNSLGQSNARHTLISPENFAALGFTGRMSPSDVFAFYRSAAKKNSTFHWVKHGIDDKCQSVQITAERTSVGHSNPSDRRTFKLEQFHDVMIVDGLIPSFPSANSSCGAKFVGNVLASLNCGGRERKDGKTVLDEFRDRFGPPDGISQLSMGSRAEWFCSSKVVTEQDFANLICRVTIDSTPVSYKLSFARNTSREAKQLEGQAALYQKNGCAL